MIRQWSGEFSSIRNEINHYTFYDTWRAPVVGQIENGGYM